MKIDTLSFRLLFLVFLSITTLVFSQTIPPDYYKFVKKADSLYKLKIYRESGLAYNNAIRAFGGLAYPNDRYNAACSWARANEKDSAFKQLSSLVKHTKYNNYNHIINDSDLSSLHNDKRWAKLVKKVRRNYEKEMNPLRKKIDAMEYQDQKWLKLQTRYWNKLMPKDSLTEDYLLKKIDSINTSHYNNLERIVKKYGFPNYDKVGYTGCINFWLLVQHQDKHTEFQKKVLVLMKYQVDKKKANATEYAYLTDRVNINTNQLQIYGTQMRLNKDSTSYEPHPVLDPDKLNERRASVGLETIESYINGMNSRNFGRLKKRKKN